MTCYFCRCLCLPQCSAQLVVALKYLHLVFDLPLPTGYRSTRKSLTGWRVATEQRRASHRERCSIGFGVPGIPHPSDIANFVESILTHHPSARSYPCPTEKSSAALYYSGRASPPRIWTLRSGTPVQCHRCGGAYWLAVWVRYKLVRAGKGPVTFVLLFPYQRSGKPCASLLCARRGRPQ